MSRQSMPERSHLAALYGTPEDRLRRDRADAMHRHAKHVAVIRAAIAGILSTRFLRERGAQRTEFKADTALVATKK